MTPEGTGGTGASGFDETPEEDSDDFQFKTVRTDSPRHTLTTFLRLRNVGGIPGAENPWAFLLFVLFLVGVVVAQMLW